MLAFDAGIDWDIKRVEGGASSMLAGGMFNMALNGTGWVALLSDGPPVMLDVASAPTFADAQAAITWSSGVQTQVKVDANLKTLIGRGSGETVQMAFSGQGWVLVQPSEGRVQAAAPAAAAALAAAGEDAQRLRVTKARCSPAIPVCEARSSSRAGQPTRAVRCARPPSWSAPSGRSS